MTLRLIPEIFYAIDVIASVGEELGMVDSHVMKFAHVESIVGPERVGVNNAVGCHFFLDDRQQGLVSQFFQIYFMMTGLHGLHVLIGMGLITWILIRALRGEFGPSYYTPVDLVGLYWHLVDLIWIFLFPLLYLIH